MALFCGKVLVYGGKGALGNAIINHFKSKNIWIINIDLTIHDLSDVNVVVDLSDSWIKQEQYILSEIEKVLGSDKLDAILCVAGGWAGGNVACKEFIKNTELMYQQSLWSSTISARIASLYLKPKGLLQLTGAAAALNSTPSMIGYGLAKAAVHHFIKSLANDSSGLPENSTVLAILPITLDTPSNRKWMPKADFSKWTPLNFIAEKLYEWVFNINRPQSGSLLKLETKNNETNIINV